MVVFPKGDQMSATWGKPDPERDVYYVSRDESATYVAVDQEERAALRNSQPVRWRWEAALSLAAACLCGLALWRGIIWLGGLLWRILT